MTSRFRVTRWATVVLSCVLLFVTGLVIVGAAPSIYTSSTSPEELERMVAQASAGHVPGFGPPQSLTVELPPLPPEQQMLNPFDAQFANYDNIMVEVKRDGSLKVLGELMAIDTFKSMLGAQMREQNQTVVTIRPDDNCPFRHVGSVISVCNEAGVLHQTEPNPIPASIELKGGPA